LLTLVLGSVCVFDAVRAAIPSEVTIYYLSDTDKESISLPSNYYAEYTIPVNGLSGTPTFKVKSGGTANVTSNGVIRPKGSYTYWKPAGSMWAGYSYPVEGYEHVTVSFNEGVTTITVSATDFSQDIKVTVKSYAGEYVNNRAAKIVKDVAYSGLTDYQKLYNITKWVADNTIYNVSFTSTSGMLIHNKGDCWASANTIIFLCKKAGVNCRGRDGAQDPNAGSNHMNALAHIGNKYYVAEAGFYEVVKPRTFRIFELPMGYSVSGSMIYQYDGDEKHVKLPTEINGVKMTKLGKDDGRVFVNGIESLHISATIESIGRGILYKESSLVKLTVDSRNKNFSAFDDCLYSSDQSVLLFTLKTKKSVTISPKARRIATTGISNVNLDTLYIPGTVKNFSLAAFVGSTIRKMKIGYGVEVMEGLVFQGLNTPQLFLPDSIKLDEGTFYQCNVPFVFLPRGANLTYLPIYLFQKSRLKRIEIPPGVTTIGTNVFYDCRELEKVYIPDTVTQIRTNTFAYTPMLKDIYYQGSEEQWNKIDIWTPVNTSLINLHFNSEMWVETIVDWDIGAASTYRNWMIVTIWALINFVIFITAH